MSLHLAFVDSSNLTNYHVYWMETSIKRYEDIVPCITCLMPLKPAYTNL